MDGLTNSEVFILIIALTLLVVVSLGGILASGLILGLLSSVGTSILLVKMQDSESVFGKKAYNWLLDHKVLADVVASVAFVFLLNPATVTGLIAGVSAVIFSSAMLVVLDKGIGKAELTEEESKEKITNIIKSKFFKKEVQGHLQEAA